MTNWDFTINHGYTVGSISPDDYFLLEPRIKPLIMAKNSMENVTAEEAGIDLSALGTTQYRNPDNFGVHTFLEAFFDIWNIMYAETREREARELTGDISSVVARNMFSEERASRIAVGNPDLHERAIMMDVMRELKSGSHHVLKRVREELDNRSQEVVKDMRNHQINYWALKNISRAYHEGLVTDISDHLSGVLGPEADEGRVMIATTHACNSSEVVYNVITAPQNYARNKSYELVIKTMVDGLLSQYQRILQEDYLPKTGMFSSLPEDHPLRDKKYVEGQIQMAKGFRMLLDQQFTMYMDFLDKMYTKQMRLKTVQGGAIVK